MEHGAFYECWKCQGLGFVPFKEQPEEPCWIFRDFAKCDECRCDVCWGKGPLDWIENIVGREKPDQPSSCYGSSSYYSYYSSVP
jgi:hypothetical protein